MTLLYLISGCNDFFVGCGGGVDTSFTFVPK